jgi:hypothetical protein
VRRKRRASARVPAWPRRKASSGAKEILSARHYALDERRHGTGEQREIVRDNVRFVGGLRFAMVATALTACTTGHHVDPGPSEPSPSPAIREEASLPASWVSIRRVNVLYVSGHRTSPPPGSGIRGTVVHNPECSLDPTPCGMPQSPYPARVVARRMGGGERVPTRANTEGYFELHLQPGRYLVRVNAEELSCPASRSFRVLAGGYLSLLAQCAGPP